MNRKCLVLGGNGYLGYSIVNELVKTNQYVRCLEYNTVIFNERIPNVEYIIGDAFDTETLTNALDNIDIVYYCISTSMPNNSDRFLSNEIRCTLNSLDFILSVMIKCHVSSIVFPSSGGAIYGEQTSEPVSEEATLAPVTTYGVGKQLSETLIEFYCRKYIINAYVYRIGNVYGSKRMRAIPQGIVDVFIQEALQNQPIMIWGDAVNSVRDYIYLDDAAKAIVSSSMLNLKGFNVFNVGTGIGTSVQEIIRLIEESLNTHIKVKWCRQKPSGVKSIVLNSEKIQKATNWKPCMTIEKGVQKTIEAKRVLLHR